MGDKFSPAMTATPRGPSELPGSLRDFGLWRDEGIGLFLGYCCDAKNLRANEPNGENVTNTKIDATYLCLILGLWGGASKALSCVNWDSVAFASRCAQ